MPPAKDDADPPKVGSQVRFLVGAHMAPSSSGKDASLSRWKPEFDSPWGYWGDAWWRVEALNLAQSGS